MDVFHAIARRRSVKKFRDRPVREDEIQRLLDAAVLAPNHRMTEPWGFLVLGPEAKRAYAVLRAGTKAAKLEDEAAAAAVRAKIESETAAVPCIIAVTSHVDEDPIGREEDFAATWMAVQNLALAAVAIGLGTHIRTGRLFDRPEMRAALDVPDGHRVLGALYVGEPAEERTAPERAPAAAKTRWLP